LRVFRIKICGITNPSDARLAEEAGADAIGLNFYQRSPRFITRDQAPTVAAATGTAVLKVGVFVNASAEEIAQHCTQVPLDVIQLHGDEPPEFLKQLPDLPVIRAFRCGSKGLSPLIAYLDLCAAVGRLPTALLIDAQAPGQYGGSGQTVDWTALPSARAWLHGLPVILAGGLTPANVAQALEISGADGADVASGVEISPGMKDGELVRSFVTAARGGK
jgi:phosphoribosylanthranilate isomerase